MALRYQEVKLEIKKLILSSKEGSRIPSRNFLSRKYQVARNTIDKAITELEQVSEFGEGKRHLCDRPVQQKYQHWRDPAFSDGRCLSTVYFRN